MQIDSQFVLTQIGTPATAAEANQSLDWAALIAKELELAKAYERNLATKAEPAPPEARPQQPPTQILLPEVENREGRQKEELKQQVWKEQFREEVKLSIDAALADAPAEIVRNQFACSHLLKQQPLESDDLALHAGVLRNFNEQMDSEVLKLQAECSKMSDDLANAARAAHKLLVSNLLSLESSLPPPVTLAPPPTAAPVVSSLAAPPATTTDEWSDTRSIDDDPADYENGFFDAEES